MTCPGIEGTGNQLMAMLSGMQLQMCESPHNQAIHSILVGLGQVEETRAYIEQQLNVTPESEGLVEDAKAKLEQLLKVVEEVKQLTVIEEAKASIELQLN